MSRGNIVNVRTFIDWDSSRRILSADTRSGRTSLGLRSMMCIQDLLAEILVDYNDKLTYRISYRIYHGWHRGKTKTDDYREFEEISNSKELSRRLGRCSFSPEISFGNALLCGGKRSFLFDTLRRREDTSFEEQKMVDTALISDLLTSVRQDRDSIHIVLGDDDDLVPGVITADSWGAKIFLARIHRVHNNSFLNVSDLIYHRKVK